MTWLGFVSRALISQTEVIPKVAEKVRVQPDTPIPTNVTGRGPSTWAGRLFVQHSGEKQLPPGTRAQNWDSGSCWPTGLSWLMRKPH